MIGRETACITAICWNLQKNIRGSQKHQNGWTDEMSKNTKMIRANHYVRLRVKMFWRKTSLQEDEGVYHFGLEAHKETCHSRSEFGDISRDNCFTSCAAGQIDGLAQVLMTLLWEVVRGSISSISVKKRSQDGISIARSFPGANFDHAANQLACNANSRSIHDCDPTHICRQIAGKEELPRKIQSSREGAPWRASRRKSSNNKKLTVCRKRRGQGIIERIHIQNRQINWPKRPVHYWIFILLYATLP